MTTSVAYLITSLVGVGVSAYGQFEQQKSAQQQARSEAAWHSYNAKVAEREAEAERVAAAFETKQHKRQAEALLSRQRALIGKTGVEMVGSPLLVAEDTAAQLALEGTNIRMRGQRRAQAYVSQSILDISKAGAARRTAAGYGKAAIIGTGASILSGTAESIYKYKTM